MGNSIPASQKALPVAGSKYWFNFNSALNLFYITIFGSRRFGGVLGFFKFSQ